MVTLVGIASVDWGVPCRGREPIPHPKAGANRLYGEFARCEYAAGVVGCGSQLPIGLGDIKTPMEAINPYPMPFEDFVSVPAARRIGTSNCFR